MISLSNHGIRRRHAPRPQRTAHFAGAFSFVTEGPDTLARFLLFKETSDRTQGFWRTDNAGPALQTSKAWGQRTFTRERLCELGSAI